VLTGVGLSVVAHFGHRGMLVRGRSVVVAAGSGSGRSVAMIGNSSTTRRAWMVAG
jgi:hypothetical protein